jgi:hypothetical protein
MRTTPAHVGAGVRLGHATRGERGCRPGHGRAVTPLTSTRERHGIRPETGRSRTLPARVAPIAPNRATMEERGRQSPPKLADPGWLWHQLPAERPRRRSTANTRACRATPLVRGSSASPAPRAGVEPASLVLIQSQAGPTGRPTGDRRGRGQASADAAAFRRGLRHLPGSRRRSSSQGPDPRSRDRRSRAPVRRRLTSGRRVGPPAGPPVGLRSGVPAGRRRDRRPGQPIAPGRSPRPGWTSRPSAPPSRDRGAPPHSARRRRPAWRIPNLR